MKLLFKIRCYLLLIFLSGCMSAVQWKEIPPQDRALAFTAHHNLGRDAAFLKVETALAESYSDLPRVPTERSSEAESTA
jgi:hypothetical protein